MKPHEADTAKAGIHAARTETPPARVDLSATADPDGSSSLIDVPFEKPLFDTPAMLVTMIVGTVVALVITVMILSSSLPRQIEMAAVGVVLAVIGLIIWGIVRGIRNDAAAKARRVLAQSGDRCRSERLAKLVPELRGLSPQYPAREAVKALAAEEWLGQAVRVVASSDATPVEPIAVPFEPRRFDELAEIDVGNSAADDDPDDSKTANHTQQTSKPPPRGIKRNLLLKGGWLLVAIYAINLGFAVFDSIRRRTVTVHLMLWTLVLIAFTMIPAGTTWLSGRQWLAVPGALIVRRGGWFRRRLSLRMFERRTSIVMLYRYWRHQWVLVVADGESCESTIGTKQELESALRAWLSPLAPPTADQLSELA